MVLFPKNSWDIEDLVKIAKHLGINYEITPKGNFWVNNNKEANLITNYIVCPQCHKVKKKYMGFVCEECHKKNWKKKKGIRLI